MCSSHVFIEPVRLHSFTGDTRAKLESELVSGGALLCFVQQLPCFPLKSCLQSCHGDTCAKLESEPVSGRALLELWCNHFHMRAFIMLLP
jgi:hypothetical protein